MKKQKKSLYSLLGILMTICMLSGVLFVHPVEAEAAAFKAYSVNAGVVKVGKHYIHTTWDGGRQVLYSSSTKNGKGKAVIKSANGRTIGSGAVSNGTTIYYTEIDRAGDGISYIYRSNINGKNSTYIAKVNGQCDCAGYYNGIIYLNSITAGPEVDMNTYQLDTKTKKVKRIINFATVQAQYKQYLLARSGYQFVQSGAPYNRLYVYNCKTKKKVNISSKATTSKWISGKVYYAERINSTSVRIKSCSANGKNQKILVNKLSNANGLKITSKSVYYMKGGKYYRYSFKMKKSIKSSFASYTKISS